MIKRALISVYDKAGLLPFAESLVDNKIEIISSGGTAAFLREHNIPVQEVESLTDFPEMLDGRVKTLHPKIHGGILHLRDNQSHLETIDNHNILPIDLVVINLYPFEETINKPSTTIEQAIEQIDIGGPSLIRSAAKNHKFVAVLTSPSQYESFIDKLSKQELNETILREYAETAFLKTSCYDRAINEYFQKISLSGSSEAQSEANKKKIFPKDLQAEEKQVLRYGENPHQKGVLLSTSLHSDWKGLNAIQQLSGKELSYNNWLDIEAAINLISEFEPEIPACAILKHNTPCGVALGEDAADAYEHALEGDPISAFGGIVVLNQEIDFETAKKISQIFLEVVIAPNFSEEALNLLKQKSNLRLIEAALIPEGSKFTQYKSILGNGILAQEFDSILLNKEEMKVVTEAQPSQEDWLSLLFAFRVVKHVRSNAIVVANGNRTVGICGGQTNRVNAVRISLEQASDLASNACLASDGFFPFADNMDLAAQGRIKAVIQPGGSIRDKEVIEAANKYNIAMVFTGMRHFKH
ncbi:MAG TPA: bifunctional phosphoribosylaminoimidazolecarboxamide formyltransferase/IMP cyclohydrolase [Vampirovibrionales bacterium]